MQVKEVTLLTQDEFQKYSNNNLIPKMEGDYWTKDPMTPDGEHAGIANDGREGKRGYVDDVPIWVNLKAAIRPVIKFESEPGDQTLAAGQKISLYGQDWTALSEDTLICNNKVETVQMKIPENGYYDYDKSGIKAALQQWVDKQGIEVIKSQDLSLREGLETLQKLDEYNIVWTSHDVVRVTPQQQEGQNNWKLELREHNGETQGRVFIEDDWNKDLAKAQKEHEEIYAKAAKVMAIVKGEKMLDRETAYIDQLFDRACENLPVDYDVAQEQDGDKIKLAVTKDFSGASLTVKFARTDDKDQIEVYKNGQKLDKQELNELLEHQSIKKVYDNVINAVSHNQKIEDHTYDQSKNRGDDDIH